MAILNRLKKRRKHLAKFARRWPTNAYRVYDRDIPEYPWTVDVYGDHIYVQEIKHRQSRGQLEEVTDAVKEAFDVDDDHLHIRSRQRHDGQSQYEKRETEPCITHVNEGGLEFEVDLETYIDTGLFLDHRNLRRRVADEIRERAERGHSVRVLNLFCYTGAFSVWAAHAGASNVVSVDLSNTYLAWAQRNFERNGLDVGNHEFVRSDIMRFLPKHGQNYDFIILDPPSFSKSKKMEGTLEVQRDHALLINQSLNRLNRGGVLYFSTNLRTFELAQGNLIRTAEEISHLTVPEDFRSGIHRAFRFA